MLLPLTALALIIPEVRTEEAAAAAHVPGLDVRRVPERAAE